METKGRTLEQLDAVFESKNPRKASTAIIKVSDREQGSAGLVRERVSMVKEES